MLPTSRALELPEVGAASGPRWIAMKFSLDAFVEGADNDRFLEF